LIITPGALAELAGQFASALGASEWGTLLRLWHDLGKASAAFQDYLRLSNDPDAAEEGVRPGRVDHSTFGARHAISFIERTADVYREVLKQGATLGLVEHHSGVDGNRTSSQQPLLALEVCRGVAGDSGRGSFPL